MKYPKSNKKMSYSGHKGTNEPGNENTHSMGGMNYRPKCGAPKHMANANKAPKGMSYKKMK